MDTVCQGMGAQLRRASTNLLNKQDSKREVGTGPRLLTMAQLPWNAKKQTWASQADSIFSCEDPISRGHLVIPNMRRSFSMLGSNHISNAWQLWRPRHTRLHSTRGRAYLCYATRAMGRTQSEQKAKTGYMNIE